MKINHKILSLPPYISTSWKNVLSLHLEPHGEGHILVVGLVNGATITVPNLDKTILQSIFSAHEKHLEQENNTKNVPASPGQVAPMGPTVIGLPINIDMDGIDQQMGSLLQHNAEAANSPDLPPEVLEKISTLAKVIGLENADTIPKAEPHCNCMHCQILRAMNAEEQPPAEPHEQVEEEVLDSDLKFRDWEIKQTAEKLYVVSNPLNSEEHYTVFLGTPLGCTCGEKNCEHIRAVLNS